MKQLVTFPSFMAPVMPCVPAQTRFLVRSPLLTHPQPLPMGRDILQLRRAEAIKAGKPFSRRPSSSAHAGRARAFHRCKY
jgi:hypothetical protein